MSFAIGLLSLAATLLNPAELGLTDAPGLELQIRKQLKVAQGDALFVRATVDGVPVHGFQIVVRRSAQGERLFVRPSGAPTRYDRLGSWSLSAEQAWQAARAEAPPVRYDDAAQARRHSATYRAWLVRDQGLLPVYIVHQASPVPLWSYESVVDAVSGTVLSTVNRVVHAQQAEVFDYDPGAERDMDATTTVTLDPAPGTRLRSDDFDISNCCVTERCREGADPARIDVNLGGFNASMPICDEMAMASPDENDDWLFEPSQYNLRGNGTFATPIRTQIDDPHAPHRDSFAEVQGYYHAHRFLDHLRALGLTDFRFDNQTQRDMPFRISVNYLMPAIPFGGQSEIQALNAMGCIGPFTQQPIRIECFYPFDNAAYLPAIGQGTGDVSLPLERAFDSVLMFQGIESKFVYAADVLYHELAHAVVGSSSKLSGGYKDDYGTHLTPGSLNEGFADYAALTITENPTLGRYVMIAGGSGIRELSTAKACPTDLTGEVHDDGEPWASSLWAFRQQLDEAERSAFDGAVLTAMATMSGRNAGYDTAANTVIEETELALGEDTASALRGYFTDQGLLGCERVRPINPADGSVPREPVIEALHLTSADSFGLNRGELIPAPYQIQINLPAGTVAAQLSWASSQGGNAGVPGGGNQDNGQILGVVKLRERIVFDYDNGAVSHDGQAVFETARRGSSERLAMTNLDVSCPQPLFVSIGTTGDGTVLRNIELQVDVDEDLAADCVLPEPPAPEPEEKPVPASGCTCSGITPSGLLWLVLAAGVRRRRR